ncbi:BamA/TamA family outer membrane protein [Vibrio sp. RE86]|uniref:BamA/TamA family outer membrane protein n=1 Tax=Vibrio sp. RE86 TaxID=2607605 RepID=UPI001493AB04|nr:BamA/TamA family outer membrane protein [Vibrio sp. RE86]NOH78726.1 BamA/TamA family outer membrane protein [Vibrio sp. RE86]
MSLVRFAPLICTAVPLSIMASEDQRKDIEQPIDSEFKLIAIPFYDPSIHTGVSVIPMYSFYTYDGQTSPSTISATLIYTQSDSYSLRGNTDLLLEKFRLVTDFGFNYSDLDVKFFDKARHKASAIQEEINFFGDLYYSFTDTFFMGIGVSYQTEKYSGKTYRDRVQLLAANRCLSYCSDIGASISLLIDTREHYYYPHGGYMFSITYEGHQEWMGNDSDATYSLLDSDLRYYHSINDKNNQFLAARWLNRYLLDSEHAPSSALSLYGRQGRDLQRGFIVGNTMPTANITSLEVEYRYSIEESGYEHIDRLTLVTLTGVGKAYGRLANPLQKEQNFSDADTLAMVGAGLRYRVLDDERINIRMDVTYNNSDEWLVYFGLGESF